MASKSSSPGPNATTAPAPKPTRSRKAAAPNVEAGRAGSAGGILLDKANVVKPKSTPSAPTTSNDSPIKTPRRKPRKLNKDPTSTSTPPVLSSAPAQPPTASEIEALKARVRGLEAKVEDLYKSGSLERPGRSPRRRGKGRKGSSAVQVPTLASTKANDEEDDVEEIGRGDGREGEGGVEELVRLEGELESARQDLAAFRPRQTRKDEEDDVEEIEREDMGREKANRHVTLSGSYRIPLPASVSVDDVRQIQSGVSAAQNVARSFLEQRRAAATLNSSQDASIQSTAKAKAGRPVPKSVSSSMEVVPIDEEGGKKSWSEWIGGYSVAISRAVRNIEHEAGVESQPAGGNGTTGGSGGGGRGGKKKKVAGTGKRPGVKTRISGEQVEGLMS